jgi:hypothetical protein
MSGGTPPASRELHAGRRRAASASARGPSREGFHQIHHSPQRIEVITSFYKHPLEMTTNSILGSLIVYAFLGLGLRAGAIYTAFTAGSWRCPTPPRER